MKGLLSPCQTELVLASHQSGTLTVRARKQGDLRKTDSIQRSLSSILEDIKTSRKPIVGVNQIVRAYNQVVHLNCATLVAWNVRRKIGDLLRLLRILNGIDS